jgi:hypothetical protein
VESRFWLYQLYPEHTMVPVYDAAEPGDPVLTREDLSRPSRYHLSYQVAVGGLVRPWRRRPGLELMLGIGYEESPTPNETFSLSNPTMDHLKLTAGVRWRINRSWRVGLTYLLYVFLERRIRNSLTNPPTNGQGYGLSHTPTLEVTYMR